MEFITYMQMNTMETQNNQLALQKARMSRAYLDQVKSFSVEQDFKFCPCLNNTSANSYSAFLSNGYQSQQQQQQVQIQSQAQALAQAQVQAQAQAHLHNQLRNLQTLRSIQSQQGSAPGTPGPMSVKMGQTNSSIDSESIFKILAAAATINSNHGGVETNSKQNMHAGSSTSSASVAALNNLKAIKNSMNTMNGMTSRNRHFA